MIRVETTRFGPIEVEERNIIRFPRGILGFEGIEAYALLTLDEANPFQLLQAVTDPDLAFVVIDPRLLREDYTVHARPEELEELELASVSDAALLAIVTLPRSGGSPTVNLMAPLVINPASRQAMQVVQVDSPYRTRHDLRQELQRSRGRVGSSPGQPAAAPALSPAPAQSG